MNIIRKELKDLAPFGVRYNPTTGDIETLLGETWTASPEADPRKVNVYPPVTTAAPRCDSAARIVSATQEVLALVLETMQTATSAFTLVGLLGRVFNFLAPYFGLLLTLFASLATAVIGVGYAALDAQFSAFDWDAFRCKLMDTLTVSGRIDQAGFDSFMAWIDATYSIEIRLFFHFVYDGLGFAGLNAAAATRSDTGVCSCGYLWGHAWDFTQGSENGWTVIVAGDGKPRALYDYRQYRPAYQFPNETRMLHNGAFPVFRFNRLELDYTIDDAGLKLFWSTGNPTLVSGPAQDLVVGGKQTFVRTAVPPLYFGYLTWMRFDIARLSGTGGTPLIHAIRMWGQEAKPAFTDGQSLA